jgi:hypothetical protein
LCWITDGGLNLLAELDKPIVQASVNSLQSLTQSELKQLISILEKVRAELV